MVFMLIRRRGGTEMKEVVIKMLEDGTAAHIITTVALCWIVTQAARVTVGVSASAGKISKDGWKNLLAVTKAHANFFVTVAFVIAILLRHIDRISQDLFITLFIAYLAFLGVKFSAESITFQSLVKSKEKTENSNKPSEATP